MLPLSRARVRARTCARTGREISAHKKTWRAHFTFFLKNCFFPYFAHVVLNIDERWYNVDTGNFVRTPWRAVDTHVKKPRFLGFFKNLKS